MPLALQDGVVVETTPNGVVLRRRGVPVDHPLIVAEALALSAIDSAENEAAAADFVSDCLGGDSGRRWVAHSVHRFWPFLRERGPDEGCEVPNVGWLRGALRSGWTRPPRRAVAPRAVTWLVTIGCNRRCPYCFYDVFPHAADELVSPPDATLPLERAIEMVREMGRIGAGDLYLTGGEPLLRADLADVVTEATAAHVRTRVVTKFSIDPRRARQLAAAGLTAVTYSLDDARPREAAIHAGARDYLAEATASVEALRDAGIPVDVNCVVTALNEDALPQLAERLLALGVARLTLGRLSQPARSTRLSLWPRRDFATTLAELRDSFVGRLEIEGSSGGGVDDEACQPGLVCDVGITALDILPDGAVTRCRYLPARRDLIVGSVRDQSLLDIWQSDALAALLRPARTRYADTACSDCDGFEACHDRGRCYFTAIANSGQPYAPDAFCRR